MSRLPRSTDRFDLLVIGGGIHGLFAALEAARIGRRVCLVERDDFGSGLSFNHQRTVHGGLRALESGNLAKARQQIAERRAWAIMAPHLLRPLPFVLPTRDDLRRSRWMIGAGFRLYDWLGRDRNAGVPTPLHLPPSRLESPEATVRLFPEVSPEALTGAAVWHDYQVRHPDRLNWLVALAAERAGATLLNHAEAIALRRDGARVGGAQVRDSLSGEIGDVAAPVTMICVGGAIRGVHQAFGLAHAPLLVEAANILVDRPAIDVALAAPGSSGRTLTATPWGGRWLVGTFQSDDPVDALDTPLPTDRLDAMIDDANSAFPSLRLRRRDVLLVHRGVVPAVRRRGRLDLLGEPVTIDHAASGHAGAFTLVGVKFTTARLAAREALRRAGLLGSSSREVSAPVPLPHGATNDALTAVRAAMAETGLSLEDDVVDHLVDWYATEAADVVRASAAEQRVSRLAPDSPVLDGEILYAVDHAKALTLADAVLRRTSAGATGHPGMRLLEAAADVMAQRLGWSAAERVAQIALVQRRYQTDASEAR